MSQADFAALVGSSKGAQLKWEKDQSTPTGLAFGTWAEAGADILFIITGTRRQERQADEAADVGEEIETIARELLDPDRIAGIEGQSAFLSARRNKLRSMIDHDGWLMTDDVRARAEQLLELIDTPAKLHDAQAAHLSEARSARDQARRRLAALLEGEEFSPGPDGIRQLAALSTDYQVPVRTLVNLAETLHYERPHRDGGANGMLR